MYTAQVSQIQDKLDIELCVCICGGVRAVMDMKVVAASSALLASLMCFATIMALRARLRMRAVSKAPVLPPTPPLSTDI